MGNKAHAVSTFKSTLIYLGGTQNQSSFRRQIPLFSAAQESREHENCTRQRPLPSSPVQLPSAKGKSIPAVRQRWADWREQGSTAWMAATWLHFRSRIQHFPKALQTGNGFCMEFFVQVQWSSWRVHSCSPSLSLLLAARERHAVQYTRRVQVKPSLSHGKPSSLRGRD